MTDIEIAKGMIEAARRAGVLDLVRQILISGSLQGATCPRFGERSDEEWRGEKDHGLMDLTSIDNDTEFESLRQMGMSIMSRIRQKKKRKKR